MKGSRTARQLNFKMITEQMPENIFIFQDILIKKS